MSGFLPNVIFEWDGDHMVPLPHFRKRCDEKLVVHQHYRLEVREYQSTASRNHYQATLQAAWENLPENLAPQFPSKDHLRRTALIRTGYRDETQFVLPSSKEAWRLALTFRRSDSFAIISVHECVVVIMRAKSQSESSMGKAEFEKSKQDVLQWVSDLIGVDVTTLKREREAAA